MIYVNEHYLKLTAGYLFPEIGRRIKAFCDENSSADVIRLGIGDVTEPLAPAIIQAMHTAVDELAGRSSVRPESQIPLMSRSSAATNASRSPDKLPTGAPRFLAGMPANSGVSRQTFRPSTWNTGFSRSASLPLRTVGLHSGTTTRVASESSRSDWTSTKYRIRARVAGFGLRYTSNCAIKRSAGRR